jgi:TonB-dependent starch-binding outer membrane protein SusC
MWLRRLEYALLLGILTPAAIHAQDRGRITGVVTSSDTVQRAPVSRAQITVQGTQLGAITDATGRYTITNVPTGQQTLRITALGFGPTQKTVTVVRDSTVVADFRVEPLAFGLQGVVVVGYGTQKKDEITGSVASITSDQFVKGPARDAAAVLAGKVPGLRVSTPSGDPRDDSEIQLRGVTTIQGARSPLVLIDGVPGNLETVPPQDIEAVSVLKDGSAAAVYGSRASNGVILITTKRHDGGTPTLRYDGSSGIQTIYNRPDFLSAADYRRLKAEGVPFEDMGTTTDWLNAMLRNPVSHRHNLTISGGAATTNYTASLNYEDDQGIFLRSNDKDISGRANIRHAMFDGKLEADLNLVLRTESFFEGPNLDYSWRQALIRNPTDSITSADGTWKERGTYQYFNPLGLIHEQNGETEQRTQRLHGTVTFRPFDQMRFALMGGTTRGSEISGYATTFRHINTTQSGQNGTAFRGTESSLDRILEMTGTYENAFGDHNVTVLGGYGYQDFLEEEFTASNSQFPTDLFGFDQLGQGTALTDGRASMFSTKSSYKLIGFFGRLNYDWQNRLLLMGSVRYEGNSRFGADHKWGTFPAVSAGWRLSEEGFMRRFPAVNDLLLRVGYGVTGIAPTSSYLSLTSYGYGARFFNNGTWVQGLSPRRNPNPNLRWEEKHEINTGVTFAMFDSRVSGSLDVYRRDTRDMLYNYSVPVPPYLFNNILANVGRMRNKGVEAQLSYDVFNGNRFRWTTSANWSTNSNKLVSLSNETFRPLTDCFFDGHTGEPIQLSTHRVCVGNQIGDFFGYKAVDIDTAGKWIVLDKDGERISIEDVTEDDRHVLGNGLPKQHAAWNNTFRYGNFDLDVNMRGAFRFQILNFQRMYYENPKIVHYNMLRSAFDNVYGKRRLNYDLAYVDYYIEDGDYWKLDNVTLGYAFGQGLMRLLPNLRDARFYVSGRNLLTFTGYKGMDPEVPTNGLNPGTDHRDQFPTTRMFTFGLVVSF